MGQFVNLPLTVVKISLGIFKWKAQDKEHMWGTLGHTPAYSKHLSCGQCHFDESHHIDSVISFPFTDQTAGGDPIKTIPTAQGLHCMLQKVFASYIELQHTGFKWDPSQKNKMHKDAEFILFTPFVKVDSNEAETPCGKFTSRTDNVSMLCRYFQCPTKDSDKPFGRYQVKNVPLIKAMTDVEDVEGLRKLSQHCIKNSAYNISFGMHNDHKFMALALWICFMHCCLICLGIFMIVSLNKLVIILNCQMKLMPGQGNMVTSFPSKVTTTFPKMYFASGILRGKL